MIYIFNIDNKKTLEQHPRHPAELDPLKDSLDKNGDPPTGSIARWTMFAAKAQPLRLAVTSFLLFVFAISAHAQGTNATLSGTVTDSSGAVLPGADLTLTNEASGFEAKSTS